MFKAIVNVT